MTRTYQQYEVETFGEPMLADGVAIAPYMTVARVVGINEDEYGDSTEFEIRVEVLTGLNRHNDGWYAETVEGGFVLLSDLHSTHAAAKAWILGEYQKEKEEIDAKIRRLG